MTDFLAHYGVKGMKWHKRKAAIYDTSSDAAEIAREGYTTADTIRYAKKRQKVKAMKSSLLLLFAG